MISIISLMLLHYAFPHELYNTTTIESSPGLYYEKYGSVRLTNDDWPIIVTLDLSNYNDQYTSINQYIDKLRELCATFKDKSIESVELENCKTFLFNFNSSYINLAKQNSVINSLLNKRIKRGLFNAVGTISKTLFGTLDNDDAEYYDSQIIELHKNDDHIVNLLKSQTTIIETVVHSVNSSISEIKESFKTIDYKIKQVEVYLKNLDDILNQAIKRQELFYKLNDLINFIMFNIEQFTISQLKLTEIIFNAQQGNLHINMLDPMQLFNELLNVQSHLPEATNFPVPVTKQNIHLYYKIIKPTTYVYNNKLNFMLNIPLVSQLTYDLIKLSSFPTLIENNTYAFIHVNYPYLIIDRVREHYFLVNENYVPNYCQLISVEYYICKQTQPLLLIHGEGACEAKLLKEHKTIPDSCDKRIVTLHHSMWIQLITPNS